MNLSAHRLLWSVVTTRKSELALGALAMAGVAFLIAFNARGFSDPDRRGGAWLIAGIAGAVGLLMGLGAFLNQRKNLRQPNRTSKEATSALGALGGVLGLGLFVVMERVIPPDLAPATLAAVGVFSLCLMVLILRRPSDPADDPESRD